MKSNSKPNLQILEQTAPQPMLQCVEDATGIVTQSSTEALHETPVVNILFSQTDGASAGMKVER